MQLASCECGKERPPVAVSHNDPFCSTECAKKHFGTYVEVSKHKFSKKNQEHGTMHSYKHRNCRCEACTLAMREYKRPGNERAAQKRRAQRENTSG